MNFLRDRLNTLNPFENSKMMVDFYKRFLYVHKIPVPTIAAINGAAVGAGMCMTLACDYRVAAVDARIGFTFSKLGIHPGMGSSVMLARLISQQYASYLLTTGKIINAQTAYEKGLILECVSSNDINIKSHQIALMERVFEICEEINSAAPISVQTYIQTSRNYKFENLFDTLLWREADTQAICYSSKDFAIGLESVEKKIPINEVKYEGK